MAHARIHSTITFWDSKIKFSNDVLKERKYDEQTGETQRIQTLFHDLNVSVEELVIVVVSVSVYDGENDVSHGLHRNVVDVFWLTVVFLQYFKIGLRRKNSFYVLE